MGKAENWLLGRLQNVRAANTRITKTQHTTIATSTAGKEKNLVTSCTARIEIGTGLSLSEDKIRRISCIE
jgi:hypothetical protein